MPERKSLIIYEKIKSDILARKFGEPGDKFITIRKLMLDYSVSLVTAQRIMTRLKENGLVCLSGKTTYLSYDKISPKSEFRKKHKKTNMIGLHVVNIDNPYFSAIVRAVEEEAKRNGYSVITKSSNYDASEEREALAHFEALGVDGVISCPTQDGQNAKYYRDYKVPFVFMSASIEGVPSDAVLINNYAGGGMVARHFLENDYEHFMYVTSEKLKNELDARLKGFKETLEKKGKKLLDEDITIPEYHGKAFENHIVQMIKRKPKPLGVFCYHDILAIGVLRICQQYGYKVPSEVGIVGYDNLRHFQDMFPTLSSVDYRINNLVTQTVKILLKRINGYDGENETYLIEPILTVKGSSGGG